MDSPPLPAPDQAGRHPLRHRRLAGLATATVLLAGAALVSLPAPVYAAQVTAHIDREHPALAPDALPSATDPSTTSTTSTGSTGSAPLTPDQAQQLNTAGQPGRLHATSEGIKPFTLLGVSARTPGSEAVLVRVHQRGAWGPWTALAFDGGDAPDPSSAEARAAARATGGVPTTEGLWFGPSDGYELSLPPGSSGLTVQLARESTVRVASTAQPAAATAALDGNRPTINPRSSWGARPPKEAYDYAPSVEHAIVHHSVTQNVYTPADVPGILRSIQAFHMDGRGWNDIAYNFAVDKFGGVWEARGGGTASTVIGGHALGANTSTTGIVTLGDFSTASPTQPMIDALGDLIGWKLYVHGVNPNSSSDYRIRATDKYPEGTHVVLPAIIGHRDVGLTGCPGDYLYPRLAEIQARAASKWTQLKAKLVVSNPVSMTFLEVNTAGQGTADATPQYSMPDGVRLACHLNGDGVETPVTVRAGWWYLSDDPSGGAPTKAFGYGDPGDIPLCGDWNGDGIDTPGVVPPRHLVPAPTPWAAPSPTRCSGTATSTTSRSWVTGTATASTAPGCSGRATGTCPTQPAVRSPTWPSGTATSTTSPWWVTGTATASTPRASPGAATGTSPTSWAARLADMDFGYGNADDIAIVGDWDGDHTTTPAVIRFP